MRLALIASLLLVIAGRAAAQPGTPAPPPAVPSPASSPAEPALPAPAPTPAPPPAADGDRDETTAVLLSLGGTVASWTVLISEGGSHHNHSDWVPVAAVSALIAPSFGHWYAGTPITGWLGVRVGAVVGLLYLESRCDGCDFEKLVLTIYGLTALGEIASAPAAVRRHNEERRALRDLAVSPMIQRRGGGIVLGARF